MKKHYKITESESLNPERTCYLYILRHMEYSGEQNTKIGVSYNPEKRCNDCTSSYNYEFFLYRTYEIRREVAIKVESILKAKYKEFTIEKWKEFFRLCPDKVHSDVLKEIKKLGGSYARSHYPA